MKPAHTPAIHCAAMPEKERAPAIRVTFKIGCIAISISRKDKPPAAEKRKNRTEVAPCFASEEKRRLSIKCVIKKANDRVTAIITP